jgi:lipopolysaccharide biosynthesis glycosyltransferase
MINVAFSVDKVYDNYALVMVSSLIKYYNASINFHVFKRVNETLKVEKYIKKNKLKLNSYIIEENLLEGLQPYSHISIDSYIKPLMLNLVDITVKELIILDVDILINSNIVDFLDIDFESSLIIAVEDYFVGSQYKNSLGLDRYFNVGIMKLNLKAIRESGYMKNADILLELNNIQSYCVYLDQDFFNLFFQNKIKFVPERFNFIVTLYQEKRGVLLTYIKIKKIKPIFVHFAGNIKPWSSKSLFVIYARKWRLFSLYFEEKSLTQSFDFYNFIYGIVYWLFPRLLFNFLVFIRSNYKRFQ